MTTRRPELRLGHRYHALRTRLVEAAHAYWPGRELTDPVFILGCGRSGKSTLAGLFAAHVDIVYLDEPRRLWFAAFPQADIWTRRARARQGRLVLDETDYDAQRARRLRRLFAWRADRVGANTLIEELAINNFRIELIRRVFPRARFIHVYRSGCDVADLIAKAAENGHWFGAGQFKWHRLVEQARRAEATRHVPALCTDTRDMGLLEWRLSSEAVVRSLSRLPSSQWMEIHSDDILATPADAQRRVLDFLAGRHAETPSGECRATTASAVLAERDREIGGPLLARSLDAGTGLVVGPLLPATSASNERPPGTLT